jgi:addiction module HigA family antidote
MLNVGIGAVPLRDAAPGEAQFGCDFVNQVHALRKARPFRTNDQWRLCFVWRDGDAYEVEITDYHQELRQMIRRDELDSVDFSDVSTGETIPAVTPGDVLRLDFMEPLKLSARAVARDVGVAPDRVTEIVNGKRAITAETAILLARRSGTTPRFWMNLQTAYDLEKAELALAHA